MGEVAGGEVGEEGRVGERGIHFGGGKVGLMGVGGEGEVGYGRDRRTGVEWLWTMRWR